MPTIQQKAPTVLTAGALRSGELVQTLAGGQHSKAQAPSMGLPTCQLAYLRLRRQEIPLPPSLLLLLLLF